MPCDGSPRILITRLSHIGDCILTLPLLCALRRRFPGAYIAWATEKPADQLLANHDDLDELMIVPRGWLKNLKAVRSMRAALRARRFDIMFDPQSLTKSAALGWLSGAPLRIGMARPHGREFSPLLHSRLIRPETTHLVDRTLELLRGIGATDSQVDFRLKVDPLAAEYVIKSLPEPGAPSWMAINPGGLWRSKQWMLDRYSAVAMYAWETWRVPSIVTWAGSDERQMAEQIVSLSDKAAAVAPATNLRQLAALLSRSLLYVGGDTGPTHIAAAVGTPCVALFGPTRPEDSGPYGPEHERLQAWYQAGSCRQRRNAENLAMRDIGVSDVCRAVDRVLRKRTGRDRSAA